MQTPVAIMAKELPATGRVARRPSHTFQLRHQPYQIQPFLLAPVLPGETLKNALLQSRAVTQPVRSRLIGWWLEYYVFYVKHRDLTAREEFVKMALDPSWTPDNVTEAAASVPYYHFGQTINWSKLCLERVTEEYFRNEGEAWDSHVLDGLPIASITGNAWHDSIYDATVMPDGTVNTGDGDPDLPLSELDRAYAQWEFMRANALTTMSYEDFLRTYGVRPEKEAHRPELVRFIREWTYPTNTVNPTNGAPTTAVSWSIAERIDKDRFFKEPGFLFGVTVARPKVYLSKQAGSAAGMLKDAFSWLPAVMKDDPYTSLKKFFKGDVAGRGPVDGFAQDYWVDVRDLFLYGDQFLNFARTDANANLIDLPASDFQRRYAPETSIDKLFVGAAGGYVEQDGICNLNILGRQVDYTGQMTV